MPRETGRTLVAQNKKARHDYQIGETYEAGLVLTGTEVKTLRLGRVSLAEAFATVDDGEVWLRNVNIPEYEFGTWRNHAAKRSRKLLLHRKEIARLAKVATGKRDWDKRQSIAERDANREAQRALRARNRLGSGRR